MRKQVHDQAFSNAVSILCSRSDTFQNIAHKLGHVSFEVREFNFEAFCKIVIGQQLSGKAASTIFNKFTLLFENQSVLEGKVLELQKEDFRDVGISEGKSRYIRSFAVKVTDEPNFLKNLTELNSNEVYSELIQIDGIGPWTANIIQLFYLGDLDIFPYGDASLEKVYSGTFNQELSARQKFGYGHLNWASPFKGILALYLWEYLDQGFFTK